MLFLSLVLSDIVEEERWVRDMNSSPLVTVPVIINRSEGEPVEKGLVGGCMSEVRACSGLEPP